MARFEMGATDILASVPSEASGEAFYELGLMYASGRSVPVDLVTAHKWFNVAVARGCRAAAGARAELAYEMSSDQIAAAQREARLFITPH